MINITSLHHETQQIPQPSHRSQLCAKPNRCPFKPEEMEEPWVDVYGELLEEDFGFGLSWDGYGPEGKWGMVLSCAIVPDRC